MFKYTQALLILVGLLLVAHGTNLCSANFHDSQTDLKSDVEELADLVENLGTKPGEQSERSLPCENAKQKEVAFFVGMTNDFRPVNQPTDVVFDTVITNIGSGYGASTGRFQAPVAGTYQFDVILGAQPNEKAAVWMVKNGLKVMEIYAVYIPQWGPGSKVAILSLKAGDQVWLEASSGSHILGRMYTILSGFLIFED